MALFRDVIFRKGPNPLEVLASERLKFNLKALTKVTIRFDPFADNVKHVRTVANHLHHESVFSKNPKCIIKTEILTDRSEQTITAEAVNGETFVFKCANLNTLEIFQLLNKYVTPLAPVEEVPTNLPSKPGTLKKK